MTNKRTAYQDRQPHRRAIRPLALIVLSSQLAACATAIITPEIENEYGTEMSAEVEQQIGLYQDEALTQYLDDVGQRLVQGLGETPYTFRFAIVDQAAPNAFASPGGYVYVSRGLLAGINEEAELAGVLAHEISHVTRRHHARQAGKNLGAGLLTLPGRAVGVVSEDLGNMINKPIEAAGEVFLASYSRGQESEADQYGIRLAAAAGYSPTGIATALTTIEETSDFLTGGKHEASFFDTHPTTPTRVADINRQAADIKVSPQPPIASRTQLYQALNGLWWGKQNPQQGLFDGQLYRNQDMDLAIDFAPDWATINTPRFVGATTSDGNAFIALGSAAQSASPTQLGAALTEKMRADAGLEPTESRAVTVGDWPAYLVRYEDGSSTESVSLYYLFVNSPDASLTVVSMGLARYHDALRDTVLSLRPLTSAERQQFISTQVQLATPKPGESLSTFSGRVGNQWPPELTAILNGLDDTMPSGSTKLKVLKKSRYPGLPAP